jgi:hypothetical protein
MRLVWRVALMLAVFVGVGWMAARVAISHVAMRGAPLAEVQLSGETAGLFAGGLAAVLVGIAMVWRR